ncbi:methyltransferase, FxLD system [Nocardiopsis dassonvillei]
MTTDAVGGATKSPEDLRARMVEQLRQDSAHEGETLSPRVAQVMEAVPREAFVPGLDLEEVYNPHRALVTKRSEDGIALSSVSAPSIIATMLDRADIQPGHRVLEVGSGGYNAALIAELVGADGQVTSIDIDPDVVERAEGCLASAGYSDGVTVATADGEDGFADRAPFDRIVVTAGAWDVPPAWQDQLAEGGLMVVPLRIRGLTRCLTLEARDGLFQARKVDMCGFVRMQGMGEHWELMPYLHEEPERRVGLRLEDGPDVDVQALRKALAEPATTRWSGVTVGDEDPTHSQDLWVASAVDGWAVLTADPGAVKAGVVTPTWTLGTPAIVSPTGDSFAYRTLRPFPEDEELGELGAIGHGPSGPALAEQLNDLMRVWDSKYRHGIEPDITLFPRSTPDDRLPGGRVVDKKHTRMVITWPSHTPKEQL